MKKEDIKKLEISKMQFLLYQDPDSDEILGQCEESGRDQGHATLCVSLMGAFCQMAYSIGEDCLLLIIIGQ